MRSVPGALMLDAHPMRSLPLNQLTGAVELGLEEDLRPHEALSAQLHSERLAGARVLPCVLAAPLLWLGRVPLLLLRHVCGNMGRCRLCWRQEVAMAWHAVCLPVAQGATSPSACQVAGRAAHARAPEHT